MKKLYPLLSVLFLIYWGCEEPKEEDTTPPTVTITSPQDGSTVSELVTITCMSSDDVDVEKVELWVNGVSTGVTDDTEPYSLEWNTTTYEDGSYVITVRSYDTSGNTTDSEPITLVVDKSVELWGVVYSIENTTSINLENSGLTGEIPPEIGNLTNLTELYLHDNQLTGSIPSEIGNLTNLTYLWLNDNQLTGLIPESICDLDINWSSSIRFNISNNQLCPPYPSCIEDYVGLQDVCSCGFDDDEVVYLWGNCYSIEYTTELDLSNSGLTGEIPSEIGNLTNLTKLYLNGNQLTGSIPPEIGNLTNLTRLKLTTNQLTGGIPESICDLNIEFSNSNYFNISNNQLCPPYPSCVEDYVGEQDLSNCEGFVELWGEVYSVENTNSLDLSGNPSNGWDGGLTGEIPPELGNLTNLTYIGLRYNQLTGSIPPELGNLTNLTWLDLGRNELTGSIPSEIGNLTNLSILNLDGNQLTGSIPSEIGILTDLSNLNIDYNQLTGSIPSEIGNLTNLLNLSLHYNQLTGSIPQEIGNLTNLYYLNLSNNQLTGIIPDEICNQGDSSPFLYNNQLCPPYPSCINSVGEQDRSNCEGVVELWGVYYSIEHTTELDLSNRGLTGSIPSEIWNLTNLTSLDLSSNQLTGSIPPEIGNLSNLEVLYLYNNQLTGSIPPEIGNLTNLTYLGLEWNELTGEIPPEIGNLTNLIILNLNDNQLTGEIPSEIGNLTNLTKLYLNGNQLTGSIPPEIGNLTNLTRLILYNNQLTGSIPSEIGNLTHLNFLYLHDNQLSGIIPDEICNLGDSYIRLDENQLCPPYPSCISQNNIDTQDTSDCD
jgi:Leucine-rich repeat (LRR) protein